MLYTQLVIIAAYVIGLGRRITHKRSFDIALMLFVLISIIRFAYSVYDYLSLEGR